MGVRVSVCLRRLAAFGIRAAGSYDQTMTVFWQKIVTHPFNRKWFSEENFEDLFARPFFHPRCPPMNLTKSSNALYWMKAVGKTMTNSKSAETKMRTDEWSVNETKIKSNQVYQTTEIYWRAITFPGGGRTNPPGGGENLLLSKRK